MKAQKVIEQALKKSGAIRQKAPTLVATTKQQIDRARARAAKLAAEKAAVEAAEAAKQKAAAEYKEKAAGEIVKAQEKYEALALKELKRLDWDFAMRQMGDMTNGFEKLTREGYQAVQDQLHKIRCMQMLQSHFIKQGRGFTFTMGKYPRGTKIAGTDAEASTTLMRSGAPRQVFSSLQYTCDAMVYPSGTAHFPSPVPFHTRGVSWKEEPPAAPVLPPADVPEPFSAGTALLLPGLAMLLILPDLILEEVLPVVLAFLIASLAASTAP